MRLKLVKPDHPALHQIANPVAKFDAELKVLALGLIDIMKKSGGVGISAQQVGKGLRLVIVDDNLVMVNPEIVNSSPGTVESIESCLSMPNRFFKLQRPIWLTVKYQNLKGEWQQTSGSSLWARIASHEIDHLNAKVIWIGNEEA